MRTAIANANPSIPTVVLTLGCVGALTALVWIGKVDGAALVGLVSIIIGGAVNHVGTKSGAAAANNNPTSNG